MHAPALSQMLFSFGPVLLAAAGVALHTYYFKRPAPVLNGVALLVDAVDDLTLEFMRDPNVIHLSDATKRTFLEVVSAKAAVRKGISC